VIVAVGFTLVELLADVDVNVPGVMAILIAPAVAQLKVLLAPAFMFTGFAVKELIVGIESFPGEEFDEPVPQPASPTQTNKMNARL
jgi:hypothetical protein